MQTQGGPLFFMQAQKGGSTNLVHVFKGGGIIFYAKLNYANYFAGSTFFPLLEWGGSPQNW